MSKVSTFYLFVVSLFFYISPVSAEDPTTVEFLNEDMEFGLELIIASLAVLAAVIALRVRNEVKGGQLETSFNYFAIASIVFAILEIYQVIKELWLDVSGLGDLIELAFVTLIIMGFYTAKEALK